MILERVRKKLVIFILESSITLSLCLGMWPFTYNATSKKLRSSTLALGYCFCINALIVSLFGYSVWPAYAATADNNIANVELLDEKPLNKFINIVHITFSICTLLVIMYRNWIQRHQLLLVFEEISSLQEHYFDKQCNYLSSASKRCKTFELFVICKGLMLPTQLLSLFYTMYGMNNTPNIRYFFMICEVAVVQLILYLTQNHFYFNVLHIYRYSWLLNKRLRGMLVELQLKETHYTAVLALLPTQVSLRRPDCTAIALEFVDIMRIYTRLLKLAHHLTALYEYQNVMLLVSFVSSNIQSLFYICVILGGKMQHTSAFAALLFAQTILVNACDFGLMIAACELAIVTSKQTANILREFTVISRLDVYCARTLEILALLCACDKLRFQLCGFLDLHHKTGHQVVTISLLYLIYLVQFDFMNL